MAECDFTEWNKAFDKLRHKHETWYIFRDWLDLTIDGFTLPNNTPLFENEGMYTEKEYGYFGELLQAFLNSMSKELETKPHYDFLGEWWESDQNMTNKFRAQFFTPMNVVELMTTMAIESGHYSDSPMVMHDCCCGSGRFGLAYHTKRPQDYFMFQDLDQYAVKMTIVNMLVHGMRGVVAHANTLTNEVFNCWRVSPFLDFGGLPYVVPYGKNLGDACSFLPKDTIDAPSVNTIDRDKQEHTNKNKGTLDAWL
jgi:type I restriction enzyme M protein